MIAFYTRDTPVSKRVPVLKNVGTQKRFPPRFHLRMIYFYHACMHKGAPVMCTPDYNPVYICMIKNVPCSLSILYLSNADFFFNITQYPEHTLMLLIHLFIYYDIAK